MPRDSGGNYTLPQGPVVADTVISTDWANPTMDDLAVAMQDSLSRSGNGGMLAPMKVINGGSSAPSYSFNNDNLTGMYLDSIGTLAFTAANVKLLTLKSGDINFFSNTSFTGWWRGANGSESSPTFSFTGNTGGGMYTTGTNNISIAAGSGGGGGGMTFSDNLTTGAVITGNLQVIGDLTIDDDIDITRVYTSSGTELLPSHSFNGDTNTGMYRVSSDVIGFSVNGIKRLEVNALGATVAGKLATATGSAAAVSVQVAAHLGSGVYGTGGDNVGVAAGGITGVFVTATEVDLRYTQNVKLTTANDGIEVTGNIGIDRLPTSGAKLAITSGAAPSILMDGSSDGAFRLWARDSTLTTSFSVNGSGDIIGKTCTTTGTQEVTNGQMVIRRSGTAFNQFLLFADGDTASNGMKFRGNGVSSVHTFSMRPVIADVDRSNSEFAFLAGATAASDVWRFETQLQGAAAGDVGFPSYSFEGDSDTGIYNGATNGIYFATQGVLRFVVDNNGVNANLGTANRPGYAFTGDTDTGMYRIATDTVALVGGGQPTVRASATDVEIYYGVSLRFSTTSTGLSFPVLPTSNPGGSGLVWNDSGTLKIT